VAKKAKSSDLVESYQNLFLHHAKGGGVKRLEENKKLQNTKSHAHSGQIKNGLKKIVKKNESAPFPSCLHSFIPKQEATNTLTSG